MHLGMVMKHNRCYKNIFGKWIIWISVTVWILLSLILFLVAPFLLFPTPPTSFCISFVLRFHAYTTVSFRLYHTCHYYTYFVHLCPFSLSVVSPVELSSSTFHTSCFPARLALARELYLLWNSALLFSTWRVTFFVYLPFAEHLLLCCRSISVVIILISL